MKSIEHIAVVVPLYRKFLSPDENLAIKSFVHFLQGCDFYAVVPPELTDCVEGLPRNFRYTIFPASRFHNVLSYSRLLLSKEFYASFSKYKYILIAQADALVLSSELAFWMNRGWDYIGAPWAKDFKTQPGLEFEGVGNGGFSLRNVSSALRVLDLKIPAMPDYSMGPPPHWWHWKRIRKIMLFLNRFRSFLPEITVEQFLKKHFRGNEDIFWGKYAAKIDAEFKVASVDEAIRFAFESDPAGSYEKNDRKLPFGVHAWAKYDRGFWERMGVVEAKP